MLNVKHKNKNWLIYQETRSTKREMLNVKNKEWKTSPDPAFIFLKSNFPFQGNTMTQRLVVHLNKENLSKYNYLNFFINAQQSQVPKNIVCVMVTDSLGKFKKKKEKSKYLQLLFIKGGMFFVFIIFIIYQQTFMITFHHLHQTNSPN